MQVKNILIKRTLRTLHFFFALRYEFPGNLIQKFGTITSPGALTFHLWSLSPSKIFFFSPTKIYFYFLISKITHWQNYYSIYFQIEWDMIVVTVYLSFLNQMDFHLVQNWKENCHHDHIPFNMKGNGNIYFFQCVHLIIDPKPKWATKLIN